MDKPKPDHIPLTGLNSFAAYHYVLGCIFLVLAIFLPRLIDITFGKISQTASWWVVLVDIFLLLLGILSLFTGFGLRRYQPWARHLAIILALILVPLVPVGTAVGIFILSYLFNRNVRASF